MSSAGIQSGRIAAFLRRPSILYHNIKKSVVICEKKPNKPQSGRGILSARLCFSISTASALQYRAVCITIASYIDFKLRGKMYKNIVFDVDGTLINTRKCVREVYRKLAFEELGISYGDAELAKAMTWPTKQVLEILGFPDIPDALQKYHASLMQGFLSVNVYDGIPHTLDILKQNRLLGVVTARNKSEVKDDSTFGRIAGNFEYIITADDTKKFKPDPEPLLLFLKQSNAKPNETLYIGDAKTDFLCAKNAGIDFALALWGAETRDGIVADYFLSRPEEVLNIFK